MPRARPTALKGVATPDEAERLLGVQRLRRAARIIRPDLHATRRRGFDPKNVGWRIGQAHQPRAGELWCPWDRTAGVIGPQGSGKTLDLLTPALLSAP